MNNVNEINEFKAAIGEAEYNEQEKLLAEALVRLDDNEDFKLLVDTYTKDLVMDSAQLASLAPDQRPQHFETILNAMAFKNYLENIRYVLR